MRSSHPTPTLSDYPQGYIAFRALGSDHVYGAAILVKLSFATSCRAVSRCVSNHIAVVDLQSPKGSVRFVSVYLRPSIPDFMAALQTGFTPLITPLTVLSDDSNAKNKLWNSPSTDQKGDSFEFFLSQASLRLANCNLAELNMVPGGTTFIDITAVGGNIPLYRWFFSIHPIVF